MRRAGVIAYEQSRVAQQSLDFGQRRAGKSAVFLKWSEVVTSCSYEYRLDIEACGHGQESLSRPSLTRMRSDGMDYRIGLGIRPLDAGKPGSRNVHAGSAEIEDGRGQVLGRVDHAVHIEDLLRPWDLYCIG